MMKNSFGNKVGVCPVCDINCWDTSEGKPAIGLEQLFSDTSSGLAQILES